MARARDLLPALALLGCLPDTHLREDPRASAVRAPPPSVPDDRPPTLAALELTPAGDCIRLRVTSDRPATATATLRAGDVTEDWTLGSGATVFDRAIRPQRLPAGEPATATVLAQDAEGRHADPAPPVDFRVPPPASALVITELLINPAGSEASQEYVELRNLGAGPFPLDGVRIEDDAGADTLPALALAPGAFALVVPATFDLQSPADTTPAPDAAILRVPGRIGRDGLRQVGEVVRLVGPDGAVLSSYGGWVDASKPGWQGHSVQRAPDPAACDHPRSWSDSPQPPTPGW